MSKRPVVAIFGATGNLGTHVTTVLLLPEFRATFSKVKVLARKASSLTAQFEKDGATVEVYNENDIGKSLQDVNVIINNLVPILAAAPNLKLYLPSEYGVNHMTHDFAQPEWDKKQYHLRLCEEQLLPKGIRVCQLFNGLFLEDSIGPWFGFDTKNGIYSVAGPKDVKVSFTSMNDVGRAVAVLAGMGMEAQRVPTQVQIAGDTKSIADIAEVMVRAGAGEVKVEEGDYEAYRKDVLASAGATKSPEKHLRFLLGGGKMDYGNGENGMGNQNEFVNPGQKRWKWKTVEDLAKETGGKPWKDAEWPPSSS